MKKSTRLLNLVLLFSIFYSLFSVLTGCAKKKIVKPPEPVTTIEKQAEELKKVKSDVYGIINLVADSYGIKVLKSKMPKVKIGQAYPGHQGAYDADKRNLTLLKRLSSEYEYRRIRKIFRFLIGG